MKAHLAAGHAFVATEEAALTFADDLDKVRALGARVVGEERRAELRGAPARRARSRTCARGDLDAGGLRDALDAARRRAALRRRRRRRPGPRLQPARLQPRLPLRLLGGGRATSAGPSASLFYDAADAPADFTRLRAAAALADELAGGGPALVADTGPAALYGALPDGVADAVLVNVGNGHTICVVTLGGRLAGVFEHHTRPLDGPGSRTACAASSPATCDNDEVRDDGGHGAVLAPAGAAVDLTGLPFYRHRAAPRAARRQRRCRSSYAAPHGDMMLTGCFGLLRAFADRYPSSTRILRDRRRPGVKPS